MQSATGEYAALPVDINHYLEVVAPAGSISSTGNDMAQWIRFQLNSGVVNGKQIVSAANLLHTRDVCGYFWSAESLCLSCSLCSPSVRLVLAVLSLLIRLLTRLRPVCCAF
jgi:hypothetical protein